MAADTDTGAVSLPAPEVSIERPALYVVATPIGNLADLGRRACAVLGAVDLILAEDTRVTRRLLEHYGIATPLRALHEHNEAAQTPAVIAGLAVRGEACALVSDAGTPLLSDPGFLLVRGAIEAGLAVIPIPGPAALTAALSVAGLPTARFTFEGFLPTAPGARAARLTELAREPRTLVFYEAPHRVLEALEALAAACGDERPAVAARELTKRFETIYRGSLAELRARLGADAHGQRGEFVLLVGGCEQGVDEREVERVLAAALAETDQRSAVRIAARLTGRGRNELYERALALRGRRGSDPDPSKGG